MSSHATPTQAAALALLGAVALGCDDGSGGSSDAGSLRPAGFECLGQVAWPPAPAPSFALSTRYWKLNPAYLQGDGSGPFLVPAPGVTVDACADGSDCSSPLATGTTDALGAVTLTVPTPGLGFEGYLRAHGTGFVPVNQWYRPPITSADSPWLGPDGKKAVSTPVDYAFVFVRPFDPTKGTVLVDAVDCTGSYVYTGISITLDGRPPDRIGDQERAFFDVPPGVHEVVVTLDATGEVFARYSIAVAAGEWSAVGLGPMPGTP